MKGSSLRKRQSKFTPKKFYEPITQKHETQHPKSFVTSAPSMSMLIEKDIEMFFSLKSLKFLRVSVENG
jgi:hypothetical protein